MSWAEYASRFGAEEAGAAMEAARCFMEDRSTAVIVGGGLSRIKLALDPRPRLKGGLFRHVSGAGGATWDIMGVHPGEGYVPVFRRPGSDAEIWSVRADPATAESLADLIIASDWLSERWPCRVEGEVEFSAMEYFYVVCTRIL